MSTSSLMNPVQGYGGLAGSLAVLWVKHMVKDSSWGILQSLEGSRDGLLILRSKHISTGLHLVMEIVAEVLIASWLPRQNPWCSLSCRSSVEERG